MASVDRLARQSLAENLRQCFVSPFSSLSFPPSRSSASSTRKADNVRMLAARLPFVYAEQDRTGCPRRRGVARRNRRNRGIRGGVSQPSRRHERPAYSQCGPIASLAMTPVSNRSARTAMRSSHRRIAGRPAPRRRTLDCKTRPWLKNCHRRFELARPAVKSSIGPRPCPITRTERPCSRHETRKPDDGPGFAVPLQADPSAA